MQRHRSTYRPQPAAEFINENVHEIIKIAVSGENENATYFAIKCGLSTETKFPEDRWPGVGGDAIY